MKASEIEKCLKVLISLKRPAMLTSGPGLGKSSIVKKIAKELDYGLIDLRAALLDSVDLRGIPSVLSGETKWNAPSFFPYKGGDNGKGIIFLDELPQAFPSVQAAFSQAILDHKIAEVDLDPNWVFIAAGNRLDDRAACHRTPSMLANRLIHLSLELNTEDWLVWATENNIAVEVRMFIKWRPALLSNFEQDKNAQSFASPRTWEFVSQIIEATRGQEMGFIRNLVMGTIGEGAANEFIGFLQIYRDLPDIDEVFANAETYKIPDISKPAVLYALVGALEEKLRLNKTDKVIMQKYIAVGRRLPSEFSMMALNAGPMVCPSLGALAWIGENSWKDQLEKQGMFVTM